MATPTYSPFLLSTCSLLFISLIILLFSSLKEGVHAAAQDHLHSLHFTSILPESVCNPSTKGPNKRTSLKVVHRHGPCHKSTGVKTHASIATQVLTQDQLRVDSINSRRAFNSAKSILRSKKTIVPAKSGSALGAGNYIITVGLGSPKKDLSLIFDTGSDLTWTQCQPCVGSCYSQQEPIFDPTQSNTYTNISCNSALCTQLNSATGNKPGCSGSTCVYAIQYGDRSFSIGFLAKDKLYLTANDAVDGFVFGCGENNQGLFGSTAGLIGLAKDELSIVSQTSQKYGNFFSYCLPSKSSGTGHLTFGKVGVPNMVKYTPFADSQGTSFYYIDTLAIYVGGQKLPISTSIFSTAGTIIDSGTVITRLPPGAYTPLRDTFRQLMKKYPVGKAISILDTCYDFTKYKTLLVPKISFEFGGNVIVDLDVTGILYVVSPTQTCLAFAPNSDASDVAIFGNAQQKTLEVIYDVAGGKLGFATRGCA